MEIPKETRAAIRGLGAAQRRREAKLARDRADDERREATARRQRARALPAARRFLEWARELAATGTLDGVPHGLPVYAELSVRVRVEAGGTVAVKYSSRLGYGALFEGIDGPSELLRRLAPEQLEAMVDRVESGAIWDDITRLAGRASAD